MTGASGFLGRAVVASCVAAGHEPVALVRPTSPARSVDALAGSVTVHRGDLRRAGWSNGLGDVDAVVHTAAATSGDVATQAAGTVLATERLLDELPMSTLRRFVHVSSFSVYDYSATPVGELVAADVTSLESRARGRDAYTETKLFQERWVRERCAAHRTPLTVLRPGIVYGPGRTWAHGAAMSVGPFDLVVSPRQETRFTQVDNCAAAIVAAVDAPDAVGATFDVVDDERPTNLELHRLARRLGAPVGTAVPVPWRLLRTAGRAASVADRVLFGGSARLPEILDLPRQEARWKPVRYRNERTKAALGWCPSVPWRDAVAQGVAVSPDGG